MEDNADIDQTNDPENPQYRSINLALRFEDHVINDPNIDKVAEKTAQLVETMHGVFKKDQQNFLFFEWAYQQAVPGSVLIEGFEKFGSMRLAFIYSCLTEDLRETVTKEQAEAAYRKSFMKVIKDPNDAYAIAKYTAMDRLISEAFSITPIFENSADLNKDEEHARWVSDLASGDDYYTVMKASPRNRKIVDQITETADQASNNQNQANILLIAGTEHSGILELLPSKLRERSHAITEYNEVTAPVRRHIINFFSNLTNKD